MQKQIANEIEKFAKLTGLTERVTISHGTLYALLLQPERCDFFHGVIRTFYKDNINEDGGVNMYAVGDEFAFDFVEGDKDNFRRERCLVRVRRRRTFDNMDDEDESPAFPSYNEIPDEVDVMLNLQDEQKRGK